jgi:hypothetical protein
MALAPDRIIVMHKALHPSSFIPAGFAIIATSSEGDRTTIRFAAFSDRAVVPRAELTDTGFIAAISVVSVVCRWLVDQCA